MSGPRITLITLGVKDLVAQRAFYERLGLKASSAGNESVSFFQLGPVVLGLFGQEALAEDAHLPFEKQNRFKGSSLAWNCASEAEVDAGLELARKAGAKILKPAEKVFWGGYSGYFADPEDNLWEVAHNPFFPFDAQGALVLP
ncbi:VOC family protein [Aestuariivirga litoralis]|uniref:VOC family protein n=1 Tax=Aestuariivirga litoralis TaxID=2650924 RepID=UPI0018C4A9DA|nr:VOC family protein [Aestuariivirga litoralis]